MSITVRTGLMTATLGDDGKWAVVAPDRPLLVEGYEAILNDSFSPLDERFAGPQNGAFGHAAAAAAAAFLGGTAELPPLKDHPGRIY